MTRICKQCQRRFGGSQQRNYCSPECIEIRKIEREAKKKELLALRPWERASLDESDEHRIPDPINK